MSLSVLSCITNYYLPRNCRSPAYANSLELENLYNLLISQVKMTDKNQTKSNAPPRLTQASTASQTQKQEEEEDAEQTESRLPGPVTPKRSAVAAQPTIAPPTPLPAFEWGQAVVEGLNRIIAAKANCDEPARMRRINTARFMFRKSNLQCWHNSNPNANAFAFHRLPEDEGTCTHGSKFTEMHHVESVQAAMCTCQFVPCETCFNEYIPDSKTFLE
jgi:hypothetical protein